MEGIFPGSFEHVFKYKNKLMYITKFYKRYSQLPLLNAVILVKLDAQHQNLGHLA